ncbi:MAG: S1/P1 nuclease [Proteobacteria bacterium]|nr:S1/P1 nuclease [Pseudomonadota bacterium]
MRTVLRGVVLLALLIPGTARAWGPQGHRTVGAIADQLLTPQAHAVVLQLLALDLDKFDRPSGRSTLESVAVWADEIHGSRAAHNPWHYDDDPVCGRSAKARYCADGQCNSEQLKRLIAVLADPRAPRAERNEALKWVVHLEGDLHQPLHAANNEDRGGNDVQVALAGVRTHGRTSLHKVWDTLLVQRAFRTSNARQPPPGLPALAAEAQELLHEAGQGSPDSWAVESNNLARNVAYRYAGFACHTPAEGIVVLDADYVAAGAALVRERVLLAGARLANILNQAFAAH